MHDTRTRISAASGPAGRCAIWLLVASATLLVAHAAPPVAAAPPPGAAAVQVSLSSPADLAQDPPPAGESKPEPAKSDKPAKVANAPNAIGQKSAKPVPPRIGTQRPAGSAIKPTPNQEAQKGAGCHAQTTTPQPSPDGPQPVFVCENMELTGKPVWRGEKAEFTFVIKNEGKGDLQVLIKGG